MLIRLLASSVKEEGNMCIFLSLGYAKLLLAVSCYVFTEGIMNLFFREYDCLVLYSLIIVGKAGIADIKAFSRVKISEFIIAKGSAKLSRTVRSVIKEYNRTERS